MLNKLNKQNESVVLALETKIKTFHQIHGVINLSESSSEENTKTFSSDPPFKHATQSAVGNQKRSVLFFMKLR